MSLHGLADRKSLSIGFVSQIERGIFEREFRRYLECGILAHGFVLWSEFHRRTDPCVRPLTPFSRAALEQVLRQVRVV